MNTSLSKHGRKMQKRNRESRSWRKLWKNVAMPKPIAVTVEEGGYWVKFGTVHRIHAILFDNDEILDAINGWRPTDVGYAAQIKEYIKR